MPALASPQGRWVYREHNESMADRKGWWHAARLLWVAHASSCPALQPWGKPVQSVVLNRDNTAARECPMATVTGRGQASMPQPLRQHT